MPIFEKTGKGVREGGPERVTTNAGATGRVDGKDYERVTMCGKVKINNYKYILYLPYIFT